MKNVEKILLKYFGLSRREKRHFKIIPFLFDKYGNDESLDSFKEELSRKDKKFAIEFYYTLEKLKSLTLKKISETDGSILRHPRDVDSISLVDSVLKCSVKLGLEGEISNKLSINKKILKERYTEKKSVNPETFKRIGKDPSFYVFLCENFLNGNYKDL
jgi:hypothetical protein